VDKIQAFADSIGAPPGMLIDYLASALYKWDLFIAGLSMLGLWLIWRYYVAADRRYKRLRVNGPSELIKGAEQVRGFLSLVFLAQFLIAAVQTWDFITTAMAPQAKAIVYLTNLF
jgi:hypothetical protein